MQPSPINLCAPAADNISLSLLRSFADIEAATQRLATSILSQQAVAPPAVSQAKRSKPHVPCPTGAPPGSFLGTAEAFVAPDPSPGWVPSLESLMPDPDELFEPITEEMGSSANSWALFSPEPLGSSLLACDVNPPVSYATTCVDPSVCSLNAAEYAIHASGEGGLLLSTHDTCGPFWDLEMW